MFIPWSEPDLGTAEKKAVNRVMSEGWLTQGKETSLFEKEIADYVGAKYAVVVSSGTMALMAALMAHGIGPGDEVIAPSFTFIATINAILGVGAKPVLADSDIGTWNLTAQEAEKYITKKTRAIMPVHVAGLPVDIDAFKKLVRTKKLVLVEDSAEALGAQYKTKKVGGHGTTSVFSFHMAKLVTSVEGGGVVCDSKKIADLVRMIRNHGRRELYKERKHGIEYSFEGFGLNMRMTDILSAVGRTQLAKINKALKHRKKLVDLYKKELGGKFEFQEIPSYATVHANMFFAFLLKNKILRSKIQKKLFEKGISTRVTFTPAHLQTWHRRHFKNLKFKNAETIFSKILSVPLGNKITVDQVEKVIKALKRI